MKKVLKYFCLVIMFFVSIVSINAYTCEYNDYGVTVEYDEAGTPKVSQTKYENSKTPIVLNWFVNNKSGKINTTNKLTVLESDMIGMCPKSIYACAYEYTGTFNVGDRLSPFIALDAEGTLYTSEKSVYLFSSENEMKKDSTLGNLPNGEKISGNELWDDVKLGYEWATKDETNGWTVVGGIFSSLGTTVYGIIKPILIDSTTIYYTKYKECTTVDYSGGDRLTFNLACPNLNSYLLKFNNALSEYQKCLDSDAVCISKKITSVNESENTLKSYCKSILSEHNFDGGTEQDCLQDCLEIGTQIKQAKMKVGLISGDSGECGFSGRLLVWLSNILRWIKYILPVIVIAMGILDFIKAIAAGKDDELKKAQGSFTKRLIAAALVFLIPLILEFVLDKMGFGYDTCGLF